MNAFEFHRPASVADASKAILASDDGRFIAGGQSLLPTMKFGLSAPADLVALAGISELTGISVQGTTVRIGAMTTHATVAASDDVKRSIAALAQLADGIGDPAVRSRGPWRTRVSADQKRSSIAVARHSDAARLTSCANLDVECGAPSAAVITPILPSGTTVFAILVTLKSPG